jgi:hypothetical protein
MSCNMTTLVSVFLCICLFLLPMIVYLSKSEKGITLIAFAKDIKQMILCYFDRWRTCNILVEDRCISEYKSECTNIHEESFCEKSLIALPRDLKQMILSYLDRCKTCKNIFAEDQRCVSKCKSATFCSQKCTNIHRESCGKCLLAITLPDSDRWEQFWQEVQALKERRFDQNFAKKRDVSKKNGSMNL